MVPNSMMMKKIILFISLVTGILILPKTAQAQTQELEQLALDIQKLSQLKHILQDMYNGYKILSAGYNTVNNITKGNFNLHEVFLDGLLTVNPKIAKYQRLGEIIDDEVTMVKEYKADLGQFKSGGEFSVQEISYLSTVYSNLLEESLENLDELTMVITANKLRMSDDERLQAIDHIYADQQDKLSFLRYFDNNAALLAAQRSHTNKDVTDIGTLYNIK
jgi:DNA repair ATPase RecN